MTVSRRTKTMAGFVKFPVESDAYENTNEGGMVVKLVVVPNEVPEISGAYVTEALLESFTGDSEIPHPVGSDDDDPEVFHNKENEWKENHYPYQEFDTTLSIPYQASIVMGYTGWSGWDDDACEYWQCSYDDLNRKGKRLYNTMQELYPDAKLHLLTFLDT